MNLSPTARQTALAMAYRHRTKSPSNLRLAVIAARRAGLHQGAAVFAHALAMARELAEAEARSRSRLASQIAANLSAHGGASLRAAWTSEPAR